MPSEIHGTQVLTSEWSYTSTRLYDDPFNQVELDAVLTHSDGTTYCVPAFWSGEQTWRVRFSPPQPGRYTLYTSCSDRDNSSLHDQRATLIAAPYDGDHPLLRHGPLQIAPDRRTFAFADGTPFNWLGDTWWMGLCARLTWPDDVQRLIADRVAKGFTLIQIVAGLYPDMPALDERGVNEAGLPWTPDFARVNPAYFDMADLRIRELVRCGLMPCIVGCWGYYLPLLGIERMKAHWRYLIARWGSYPVIWCLAGEGAMPYYLSEDPDHDRRAQIAGWTEIARYVREQDPHHRLITIHPTQVGRDQVADDTVLDFDMLQTGHGGHPSATNTVAQVLAGRERQPTMPVVVGEVSYEGILHGTGDEIQRLTYWTAMLSGAAGFTYGANGLWQANTREVPYGPSPHGASWGDTPWEEAYRLTGSAQIGMARRLLASYGGRRLEPYPEWVEPAGSAENIDGLFAAGIPGELRIVYFYQPMLPWARVTYQIRHLEPEVSYDAAYWSPRDGTRYDLGAVEPDADRSWSIPVSPTMSDWVLILERRKPCPPVSG